LTQGRLRRWGVMVCPNLGVQPGLINWRYPPGVALGCMRWEGGISKQEMRVWISSIFSFSTMPATSSRIVQSVKEDPWLRARMIHYRNCLSHLYTPNPLPICPTAWFHGSRVASFPEADASEVCVRCARWYCTLLSGFLVLFSTFLWFPAANFQGSIESVLACSHWGPGAMSCGIFTDPKIILRRCWGKSVLEGAVREGTCRLRDTPSFIEFVTSCLIVP
jgi:hypothetical protein